MRIVHWFPNFLAGGGVSNSVVALAEAQSAEGAEVGIVSLPSDRSIYGSLDSNEALSIEIWRSRASLPLGALRLHWMSRGQRRALKMRELDVVHAHGEFNPDNWWLRSLRDTPIVLSPHGAFHPTVIERGGPGKRAYISVARRMLYRRVNLFHALNPSEEENIRSALQTASTYCVPQGPSPAVRAVVSQADACLSIRENDTVRFMFIGRLDVRTKGLDILIEGFAQALRGGLARPVTLTLVGPDWRGGVAELRALSMRLGIADHIAIRAGVSADAIPDLLTRCDIYTQLSRNEGSPLSLNDALVLGKPVIVSARVGTVSSEEISRLRHVNIIEPSAIDVAGAITRGVSSLEELRVAACDARAAVRDFLSWEHAAQRHLDIYANLIRNPSRA